MGTIFPIFIKHPGLVSCSDSDQITRLQNIGLKIRAQQLTAAALLLSRALPIALFDSNDNFEFPSTKSVIMT
jgi:hypothetical protein